MGWSVAHEMWRFFNPEADTEIDATELTDLVLDDESGVIGAVINAGYVNIQSNESQY